MNNVLCRLQYNMAHPFGLPSLLVQSTIPETSTSPTPNLTPSHPYPHLQPYPSSLSPNPNPNPKPLDSDFNRRPRGVAEQMGVDQAASFRGRVTRGYQ